MFATAATKQPTPPRPKQANYAKERDRQRNRKRRESAAGREVLVRKCRDRARRERLEADDAEWLRFYFADIFTDPFTEQQTEMVKAIGDAIRLGGDQALAASRGEGKSVLAECCLLKAILTGAVRFAVLFSATGRDAENSLQAVKERIETNDRLAEDYREVTDPVRALENVPNRAHYQRVKGVRFDNGKRFAAHPSKFRWCGSEIVLPSVPGSPSAGAVIATRGLDAAVRGMKVGSMRPDIAVIDDPDTAETVNSDRQAEKLEGKIDSSIAALGGQRRRLSRVMLTTLQRRQCVSAKFTDPQQKPSWRGRRFRFLIQRPAREDQWEEYVILRKNDWDKGTTAAHDFYLANRESMDALAVVANPNRHTAGEASALEFYFSEVARIGEEAVSTEYDNSPPEEVGLIDDGLTPHRIQHQVSGYARRVVPPDVLFLTQGIDVGKFLCHWTVKAWRPDATCYVLDYGAQDVHGTARGTEEGIENAIRRAIIARVSEATDNPYREADGNPVPIKFTLVDAGYQDRAVYAATRELGRDVVASKGFGKSCGANQRSYPNFQRADNYRKPGDRWCLSYQETDRLWLVDIDADHWKDFDHCRWLTAPDRPGCQFVFGEKSETDRELSKIHAMFSYHICAEGYVDDIVRGVRQRVWKTKNDKNHWLDSSYLADVAASVLGVRLLGEKPKPQRPRPQPQPQPHNGESWIPDRPWNMTRD